MVGKQLELSDGQADDETATRRQQSRSRSRSNNNSGSGSGRRRKNISIPNATLLVLLTLASAGHALSQTAPDSGQWIRACQASLEGKMRGADLRECKRSIEIALPLAQEARKRGFAALQEGKPAKAEAEFAMASDYWSTIFANFLSMAFASGMNSTKEGIAFQREANAANMYFAESYIGRARAALSLRKKDNALTFLHFALEHNQEALNWFRQSEPSSPAMGRSLYQRGLIKFLLAELGSERGSKEEACEAFRKSAGIGFAQADRWLKTAAGQACPP